MKRILSFICLFCMVFSIIAPSAAAADNVNIIEALDYKITEKLYKETIETIYDGTYVDAKYENIPTDGYSYLLVQISVKPSTIIDADGFKVKIGNKTYNRIKDDAFLKNYDYSILAHNNIIVDENGWIVFEIPSTSKNPESWEIINGSSSTQLQLANENVVEQKIYNGFQEKQAALVSKYKSDFQHGNYTIENPYIIVNPYETAPLTAIIMFNTDTAVKVTTTVVGKTDRTSIVNTVSGYNTYHELPIIGLYNGENTVKISAENQLTGEVNTFNVKITTEDMPDSIKNKQMSLETSKPEKLSDGLYILKNDIRLMVDINGDVRGYFPNFSIGESGIDEITSNGHIFVSSLPYTDVPTIYEFDAMGYVYREIQIPITTHHDALLVDEETLLTLDYQLNLNTGEITSGIPWETFLNKELGSAEIRDNGDMVDWLHPNTVSWCGDDSIIVSSRNQHAVIKLSYPDYEVEWILSVNPNASPWNVDKYLTPIGDDFEWFYSQHNPRLKIAADDGDGIYEITLFDNGVYRGLDPNASYPESEMYSRMVCYRIDENNMTVEQVWDFGEELGRDALSPVHGSTQYIAESDSYLGSFDAYFAFHDDAGITPTSDYPGRILEVTTDGEIIYDLQTSNAICYRVEKVTTDLLYSAWEGLGAVQGKYMYVGNDIVKYQGTAIEDEPVLYKINSVSATQNYLNITGWAATEAVLSGGYTAAKLLLTNESTGNAYVYQMTIDASQRYNSDAESDITDQLGPNTGFTGNRLNISTLEAGNYQISILVCQNGNEYRVDTEKVLKIESDVDIVKYNDIVSEQQNISSKLQTLSASGTYTLRTPYITVDPYGISPLAAIASFRTSKLASITVEVESKNGADPIVNQFETVSTEHQIPIYGLYANEDTQVKLTAHYQDGTSETSTISVKGNSLPSDFVPVRVEMAETAQMADGWTFIMAGSLQGYVYAIDETGAVRWLLSEKGLGAAGSLLPLSNGNYLIGGDKSFGQYYKYNLFELNMTGQIVNEYLVNGYHHDAQELPNGNLLIFANNVNGDIVEDTMYEIDRSSGDIIRTWDLNSYFNVGNYNEAGQHISDVNYGADTHDWLHTNGMDYDEETNSVLISCRHQDAVFSMSLDTGEINWILSNPDDLWPDYLKDKLLTPVGSDFEWQYGQHNISLLPNGDIMMFDNGDYRSKDAASVLPATEGYSRAVIYRIDKENMTVSQVWEFGKELGSAPLAAYVSSSQYLGENHYLIDFGGIVKDSNGNATYNIMDGIQGSSQSQIYEVKDGEIIFHASVERSGLHGNTFRAARMMPYATTSELNLADSGNRLGGLYRYGLAEAIEFDSSIAVFGAPDVQVSDNGVQLQMTSDLGNTGTESKLAIVFANDESAYKVTLPSGTSIAYTLNNSEIPTGTYELYLLKDNITYDLKLEWTNTSGYCAFPAAYDIVVETNQGYEDLVSGSGTYYANTPFTLNATENESYQFKGWYVGDKLLGTDANYTMTATSDMTITAKFFGYTDVDKTSWYYDAVYYVSKNDIMTGYSETQFAPNDTLSRAQACQVIYNIVDAEEQATEAVFSDVTLGQWYTNAIAWATKNNVVSGYGNNLFGPNDAITREQMAVILYRYAGAPSVETDHLASYTDADQISSWATDALNWCVENKIMVGNGSGIAPNQVITRAEVATIMMNFVNMA